MHAQGQPYLVSPRRLGGANRVPGGPPWTDKVRLSLSMHELSLSMPEPMLSLSMLILATYHEAALDATVGNQNQKGNRQTSKDQLKSQSLSNISVVAADFQSDV